MQTNNIPVEAISVCNTIGDIRPMRIRLEDDNHQLMILNVNEIIYSKECNLSGIISYRYGCKVHIHGVERLIELMYNVQSHKWTILKILS
ncbi:MAG: hypothetical protein K0R15_720 [Clostridiales bacterium]|nr:hypothetical protein [Clostridiales bacterium]